MLSYRLKKQTSENVADTVLFITENILIENECQTPTGCLTFISIKNIIYNKMDLKAFSFSCDDVKKGEKRRLSFSVLMITANIAI